VQPGVPPRVEVVSSIGHSVVVRLRWRPKDASGDDERYQVLAIRNEKIRTIVDCRAQSEATKVAKRLASEPGVNRAGS
jgi:hypothetical protein